MITEQQLKEWIEIWKENRMDSRLPRVFKLQDEINTMLGLDTETHLGTGIRVKRLRREELLDLTLAIRRLKNSTYKSGKVNK